MQASLIYQRQFNEKLWSLEWDHATNINIGTIIVFFLFKVSRKLVKSIILIISKLILFIEQIIKKKKKYSTLRDCTRVALPQFHYSYHNATRTLCSGLWSTESCKCLDRSKSKLYILHAYKRLYQKIIKNKIKAKIVETFKLFVFQ